MCAGEKMNQIMLTGRLTEDPKVTYSAGSKPIAQIRTRGI